MFDRGMDCGPSCRDCFTPEGTERPRLDPVTQTLVDLAHQNGYLSSENYHISRKLSGADQELQNTKIKLEESQNSLSYYKKDSDRAWGEVEELDEKVARLNKKLKPAKKVAKKGKK